MAHDFANQDDLLELLQARPDNAVYLVGSPLSGPPSTGGPGVPNVDGFIEMIRSQYTGESLVRFNRALPEGPTRRYQAAFQHLINTRTLDTANELVRQCVLCARIPSEQHPQVDHTRHSVEHCQSLEDDTDGWFLPEGMRALGEILARCPSEKEPLVLTSNFDPLLSVSIKKAGGSSHKIALDGDGGFGAIKALGTRIVHIHGEWCLSDTLHTAVQLNRDRPKLSASIRRLLKNRPLVVLAYGGWDDVFTRSLVEEVRGELSALNVLWTFYEDDEARIQTRHAHILQQFEPGIARQRVILYKGIDVHQFLPRLASALGRSRTATPSPAVDSPPALPPTAPAPSTLEDYLTRLRNRAGTVRLAGDTEPRRLGDVFVEFDITPTGLVERPAASAPSVNGPSAPDEAARYEELRLELSQRGYQPLATQSNARTLSAESLLGLHRRLMIVGAAGTGKSTLVRWLAANAARARLNDATAPLPLWFSRVPSAGDFDGDVRLEEALPNLALRRLELEEGPSEARAELVAAVASGRCIVFVDSLDEASVEQQNQLATWLGSLAGYVIIASRPRLAEGAWNDFTRLTLHGIPAIAAGKMLQAYFPGDVRIERLLTALQGLPDGRSWLETPVLLGLAASVFRSKPDGSLPDSTLELYRSAVRHILHSERIPPARRSELDGEYLRQSARDLLFPDDGQPPRVTFDLNVLPIGYQNDLIRTGLFEGTTSLRYAHLSLGEILAAEADLDLGLARARLADAAIVQPETAALEVLPMAHAIQAPQALHDALADAHTRDRADHRLLRLLLRSIGYGGAGVLVFLRTEARRVVELLAERLQAPSGRFGDFERALMDAAERALPILAPDVPKATTEAIFTPLLRSRGEASAEAYAASSLLGVVPATRTISHRWITTHRQARAILREHRSVDAIRRLTTGSDPYDLAAVIEVLKRFPRHRPRLRPFIDHTHELVRRQAIHAFWDTPDADPELVERFSDDLELIRSWMVKRFASSEKASIYFPRLRHALVHDPCYGVRAAAVMAFADAHWAQPHIREILLETKQDLVDPDPGVRRIRGGEPG